MRSRGFTLIEVLIALMLLSMVMYIGNLSFSVFSERWRKELGTFNNSLDNARQLSMLRQAINGTANYLVRGQDNLATYLFYGDEQQLVFITNSPIFEADHQAWVRLSIVNLSNNLQQLHYTEYSFKHGPLTTLSAPEMQRKSLILLEQENIRFNYYGWHSFAARIAYIEDRVGKPSWQQKYNASQIGVIPFAVNISWGENEPLVFLLPHDNRVNFLNVYDERNEV